MRVSPDQFFAYTQKSVLNREKRPFFVHCREHGNKEQDVTKLLAHMLIIPGFDCLNRLVGFFQQSGP